MNNPTIEVPTFLAPNSQVADKNARLARPAEAKTRNLAASMTIDDLRNDPDGALRTIYRSWQGEFTSLVSKYSRLDRDELADIFQDAAIILVQNVRSGKLEVLTSSVKTYLFGIGKKLLLKRHSVPVRTVFLPEINDAIANSFEFSAHQAIETDETSQQLRTALGQLGDICQRILTLTFYDNLRSAAIAKTMGYSDETVVRVQRLRCMRKLRELVKGRI